MDRKRSLFLSQPEVNLPKPMYSSYCLALHAFTKSRVSGGGSTFQVHFVTIYIEHVFAFIRLVKFACRVAEKLREYKRVHKVELSGGEEKWRANVNELSKVLVRF